MVPSARPGLVVPRQGDLPASADLADARRAFAAKERPHLPWATRLFPPHSMSGSSQYRPKVTAWIRVAMWVSRLAGVRSMMTALRAGNRMMRMKRRRGLYRAPIFRHQRDFVGGGLTARNVHPLLRVMGRR